MKACRASHASRRSFSRPRFFLFIHNARIVDPFVYKRGRAKFRAVNLRMQYFLYNLLSGYVTFIVAILAAAESIAYVLVHAKIVAKRTDSIVTRRFRAVFTRPFSVALRWPSLIRSIDSKDRIVATI